MAAPCAALAGTRGRVARVVACAGPVDVMAGSTRLPEAGKGHLEPKRLEELVEKVPP